MAGRLDAVNLAAIRKEARSVSFHTCRCSGRIDLVDDIAQDLCIALLERPRSWLGLKRIALSAIRSKRYNEQTLGCKIQYVFEPLADLEYGECDNGYLVRDISLESVEDRIEAERLLDTVWECYPSSDHRPSIRRVYIEKWIQGYSQSEIASMYGKSRSNISKVLTKTLEKLRERR